MFGLDMSTVQVGVKAILLWVLRQFINSQLPTLMRIICFFTRLGAFQFLLFRLWWPSVPGPVHSACAGEVIHPYSHAFFLQHISNLVMCMLVMVNETLIRVLLSLTCIWFALCLPFFHSFAGETKEFSVHLYFVDPLHTLWFELSTLLVQI